MSNPVEDAVSCARSHGFVVLAGAGVSADAPASLPSWKPLNEAIIRALADRIEALRGKPGWLKHALETLNDQRNADRFPPEYQAQLIHEMCGERYFRSLQSLDVDTPNGSHHAIAALAASGVVRAILTTNFDRLIEQALDQQGVPYVSASAESGFLAMEERLSKSADQIRLPLPIIKIHGCVSDPLSMIDTLKQRRLGRSAALRACLDLLHEHYWIYLGFSAEDLAGDRNYLGLRQGAERAPGALYVAWPGRPPKAQPALSAGATALMDAYAERKRIVGAEIPDVIGRMCVALGAQGATPTAPTKANGLDQLRAKLTKWADELTPAAAVLCFGAVLEAAGNAEDGVRVMDRFIRHELMGSDRAGADYQALQLHYGRMGAALGRFTAVPDLNGAASNASVETVQSLARLAGSELDFAARGLLACVWLWNGNGATAQSLALETLRAIAEHGTWEPKLAPTPAGPPLPQPRTPEEAIDGWLAAAQVAVVAGEVRTLQFIVGTAASVLEVARKTGDPVRAARAASLYLLALSDSGEDLPTLAAEFSDDFSEAARIGDGFALGFHSLALGSWHLGARVLRRIKAGETSAADVGMTALQLLESAEIQFQRQGMDPWLAFTLIQRTTALAYTSPFDAVEQNSARINGALGRFSIWTSFAYEAIGQISRQVGAADEARTWFRRSLDAARSAGLAGRVGRVQAMLENA